MSKNKANKYKFIKERRLSKKHQIKMYRYKYDLLYLFNYRCLSCGSNEKLELDHIKPVSNYPELMFERTNMQILCRECNTRKSNVDYTDFRPNLKRFELWNKVQKKAFRELINKEKIYKPLILPRYLNYKGTFKENIEGYMERKPRKRLSDNRYNLLKSIDYTLDDIVYNRREKLIIPSNKNGNLT